METNLLLHTLRCHFLRADTGRQFLKVQWNAPPHPQIIQFGVQGSKKILSDSALEKFLGLTFVAF